MKALVPNKGFKFGCDPEAFVRDADGQLVCADGLIPGTKDAPYPVERGAVQVDGMAAEFNIDPAETFEEFNLNITTVLATLRGMLPKGYTLDFSPSVQFPEDVFNAAPDHAKELGCTPDFCAWTGDTNPPPDTSETPFLRTASGHLHIGWTENAAMTDIQHIVNCQDLVKQLDWFLGAWSLQKDADPVRRSLYGKAGALRYKDYGVEYRVLSNFWVDDEALRLQVWNRMQSAIFEMAEYNYPEQAGKTANAAIIQAINTSEMEGGLLSRYPFPLLFATKEEYFAAKNSKPKKMSPNKLPTFSVAAATF